MMQESKLSAVCEKVFDRCLAPVSGGEGCDNMTMILVQFKKPESGPSTSQPLDSSNDQEVPVQEVPESD
ncbi:probable protein phosphatase 2C 60 [Tanacetum coccineum]